MTLREKIDGDFNQALENVIGDREPERLGDLIDTDSLANIYLQHSRIKELMTYRTYNIINSLNEDGKLQDWLSDRPVFFNANLDSVEILFVKYAINPEWADLPPSIIETSNLHFDATYFGDNIVFRNHPSPISKDDAELLAHETVHGLQRLSYSGPNEREISISFLTAYVEESRKAKKCSQNPYLGNIFEKEAYAVAGNNCSAYIDAEISDEWY